MSTESIRDISFTGSMLRIFDLNYEPTPEQALDIISRVDIALKRTNTFIPTDPPNLEPVQITRTLLQIQEAALNCFISQNGSKSGFNPLLFAAEKGFYSCIKKILTVDKKMLNVADAKGETALYKAAMCKHLNVVQLLIEEGADLDTQNHLGQTPLFIAATCSEKNAVVVECLINAGANLEAKSYWGVTVLDMAVLKMEPGIAKALINAGAHINAFIKDGNTLHRAAKDSTKSVVEALLRSGANVNATDRTGATPLQIAVEFEREDTAEVLIQYGAEI